MSPAPFVLFTEGAFGRAVAERLKARVERVCVQPLVASDATLAGVLDGADFAAAALWRRYPLELETLDAACHRQGLRWSSAVLEGSHLRCGPLVVPHRGPCHACYRSRWLSHAPAPEREEALDAAYAGAPDRGIAGFTPSSVGMAVAALLLDRAETDVAAGRVRLIDLLSCQVEETRVVPRHACVRCSAPRPAGERYVADLVAALARQPS